jgi:Putative transposase
MTLTHEEFLRRFLQHTLPAGFPRIRYFGFLANRCRSLLLPLCRKLLDVSLATLPTSAPATSGHACPRCQAPMRVVERFTASDLLRGAYRLTISYDSS